MTPEERTERAFVTLLAIAKTKGWLFTKQSVDWSVGKGVFIQAIKDAEEEAKEGRGCASNESHVLEMHYHIEQTREACAKVLDERRKGFELTSRSNAVKNRANPVDSEVLEAVIGEDRMAAQAIRSLK